MSKSVYKTPFKVLTWILFGRLLPKMDHKRGEIKFITNNPPYGNGHQRNKR